MSYTVDEYRREVSDKKILVVGMGRSGMAAVKELHALGSTVTAQDINTVERGYRILFWINARAYGQF